MVAVAVVVVVMMMPVMIGPMMVVTMSAVTRIRRLRCGKAQGHGNGEEC